MPLLAKATGDYGDVASLGPRLQQFLSRKLQRDLKIQDLTRYPVGFSWMTYGFTLVEQADGCDPPRVGVKARASCWDSAALCGKAGVRRPDGYSWSRSASPRAAVLQR